MERSIKELRNDLWVLEQPDQISGWIEETGRLDHDPNLLPVILKHINVGDTVIDVGAHIGDHTIAYSRKVGPTGKVYAFEPNPVAFKCLVHNLFGQYVIFFPIALGDKEGVVSIGPREDGDTGGIFVGGQTCEVPMQRLDAFKIAPNLIKIDVEGYELHVLKGGEKTINEYHPKIVLEIQRFGLDREGITPDDIFTWLEEHGYKWEIIEAPLGRNDPLYNIIAL